MRSGMSKAAALLLALALVAGACGGKKKDVDASSSDTSTSTTAASGDTSTTAAGGASTTAKAGTAKSTTTAPAPKPGAVTPATTASGVPTPARSGTYDYAQSGTSSVGAIPPNGTLVVDAADSSGKQVFHDYPDPNGQAQDTIVAFRSDGPFIVEAIQRQQQLVFDCKFDPPIPAPPWPPTTGKPINGHADCGGITAEVTGSITGKKNVTLDGKSIEVIVAQVKIVTHGQVESTSDEERWWAPSIRLNVHTHSKTNGRFGAFAFSGDVTRDLKSGNPR